MALNTEIELGSIIEAGQHRLLKSPVNNSRIVLSKLTRASGKLESCNGYGLFIPIKENKCYGTEREQYNVSPGQYLLLNYDQPCTLDVNSQKESVGLNVRINKGFVDQAIYTLANDAEKLLLNPYATRPVDSEFNQGVFLLEDNPLGKYIADILASLDVQKETLDINESELFLQIAQQMVLSQQKIYAETESIQAKKTSTRKEIYKRLCKAKMIIADNRDAPLEIAMLAKEVSLSESHFFRSFKSTYGITPHQYWLKKRLECAARSIERTNVPIRDIALACGFEDLSSFGRAFKKVFGRSPYYFRKGAPGIIALLQLIYATS